MVVKILSLIGLSVTILAITEESNRKSTSNNVEPFPPVTIIPFELVKSFPEISPFWIFFSILSVILFTIVVLLDTIDLILSVNLELINTLSFILLMIVESVDTNFEILSEIGLSLIQDAILSFIFVASISILTSCNKDPAGVPVNETKLPLVIFLPEISPF